MADDDAAANAPDEKKAPEIPAGPSRVILIVLALLGAGAGGWFGGPLAAPRLAPILPVGSGEDGGGGGGHGAPAESEADDEPLVIDNLILNPANSGGSRFLIATLVLDVVPHVRSVLESRDAEARDVLLRVLSGRTVDQLSDISLRDDIREDLRSALNAMLEEEGVLRIFLPQFVIQ